VNVNKIAYLRNTRDLNLPDVLNFVARAIQAGAQGITVHPRPDGRHIKKSDVLAIARFLQNQRSIEFNIEGNPFHPPLMELVEATLPAQATLVPDSPDAATSNHGWRPDASPDGCC
jgi:pyridoxine 5-phosphate synthase